TSLLITPLYHTTVNVTAPSELSRQKSGGEYLDGQTEMASLPTLDKARRASWEAVQSAIPVISTQP
ncbi:hypothetical protein, partial [Acetobacter senegalensis]|uniref:hypothetical protein n=1 Tax=Acetobacter senegalensis TaxID=446692 RepID=UPI002651FB9B